MPRPLSGDTITLLVPSVVVDSRDNTRYYTHSPGATIKGCSFQPFLMTEKFQEEFTTERESTRTFYRVFVPWTADTALITEKYRILFEGEEFEVHAMIGKWRDFRRNQDHIAFLVKKRIG